MRILYLYAHPLPESFHAAIRRAALDGLLAAGHRVDLCDLYEEGFDPVLSATERRGYHAVPANRTTVEPYVARLEAAEALVLSFPTWCFGLPAILKGWFDRVLLPGVSFTLAEDGIARPALTHIRKIAGISTYGRPRWNAMLVGDPPRKAVTQYLRMISGGAETQYLALYDMNRADVRRREAFLETVRGRMAGF